MQASLLLGDQAPLFSARSTEGDFLFENFREKWLFLLFCHEAFDTIATTEIISLNRSIEFFSDYKCQPLIITSSSLFLTLHGFILFINRTVNKLIYPSLKTQLAKSLKLTKALITVEKIVFFS